MTDADPDAHTEASTASRVIGVWKLSACTRDIVETGERIDQYGKDPIGYLHYTADGRMVVLMMSRERPLPEDVLPTDAEAIALFRSMGAYLGTFSLAGNEVTHHIEASWNQSWSGTSQKRYFRLDGDRLYLTTDAYRSAYDGRLSRYTLTWDRAPAPTPAPAPGLGG
jgi:hypothetical protein